MTQKNIRTGTKREVCRRPYFVSALDLKNGGLYAAVFGFCIRVLSANTAE